MDGDTNDVSDVFVSDATRAVSRVSVTTGGDQARGLTELPAISASGRIVAFMSSTYDLAAPGDRNRRRTIFFHNRVTGRTKRASDRSDGRRAIGDAYDPSISSSGRYIAFVSDAPDLAMKGDRNGGEDVFVHDRKTGKTNRVSLSRRMGDPDHESGAPAISGNGRYVAFNSFATNLVRNDDNGELDVYVYDRVKRRNDLVSITTGGKQGGDYSFSPAISGDGRYVAFASYAALADTDAAGQDVYLRDRGSGITEHVSVGYRGAGNGDSFYPSISADGRYVAFVSMADNLVPDDGNGVLDVFVRDRKGGTTTRVSVGDDGEEPTEPSWGPPELSPDGSYVCWTNASTNLDDVEDDGEAEDVFLRGPLWD